MATTKRSRKSSRLPVSGDLKTLKSRAKTLAKIAERQGFDLACVRLLSIEAFKPCMEAVQQFACYGKGSSLDADPVISKKGQRINPYIVMNKQVNAACQIEKADDPNATLDQRLARANILFRVAKTLSSGMNNKLEREDVKRIRDAAIAEEATRFGLGNKASQQKGRAAK
jgi:hypothetical protein